ncbi:MAG: class I adenylate-forming enzyme family protein [Antricoccus sp.]
MTAPGGPFAVQEQLVGEIPMRVFDRRPHTIRELAEDMAQFGDRINTVYEQERVTYAEQHATVAGLARLLVEDFGLRKGDRVAIAMRNFPEWVPWLLATASVGLIVVPLNAWWTAHELQYGLEVSQPRMIVTDSERTALVMPLLDSLGGPQIIEVRGQTPGVMSWEQVQARLDPAATFPEVSVNPDDPATMMFTSGTTGRPKAAVGTHRNHTTNLLNMLLLQAIAVMMANGGTMPEPDPEAPQPGTLNTFALFHIAGMSAMLASALVGAKLGLMRKWDRAEAREMMEREGFSGFAGVPTVARQFVDDCVEAGLTGALASVAMGGAPIPPDLVTKIDQSSQQLVAASNGYGLTETTSAVVGNLGADYAQHPDSIGVAAPGADIRFVDPGSGEDVPEGEIGELWVRGPNVVTGYWQNPEATAAAFTDGWFHTGDLGYAADGWLYVVDRIKDMVIRGGENVYCAEVEAVLFEHPAIEDVAVIGAPHESLGEQVVAIVQLRDGVTADEVLTQSIRAHTRERLAAFKVPEQIVFWPEPLPRTQTGKVLKRDLRDSVSQSL